MVEYFQLGGKKRPILYGSAAFKLLKSRKGIRMADFLSELSSGDPDVISDITFCALKVGERAERLPPSEDYSDELDVAIWIDEFPGGVAAFMQKLLESLPKPVAEEGNLEPGEAQENGTGKT